jgi:hypothetical protein
MLPWKIISCISIKCLADDYRIFCGNLGNEVDDSALARTFNKFPSFQKAKVSC